MIENIIGGAAQAIYGLGTSLTQSKYNAALNYSYGESAARRADQRQRAQYWDLYSPQAKLKQFQEAGLSPSLMYGMSGTGGAGGTATGAMGTGAGGQHGFGMAVDLSQMSQIKLNDALANKANADADKARGVDTNKAEAEIRLIMSQQGLADAQNGLTKSQQKMQDIQNEIADTTKDVSISTIEYHAEQAFYNACNAFTEWEQKKVDLNISKETAETIIKMRSAELNNLLKDLQVKNKGLQLTDEQINRLKEQTAIDWANSRNNALNANANMQNAQTSRKTQRAQQEYWEKTIETNLRQILTQKEIAELQQNEENYRTWIRTIGNLISSVIMNNAIIGSSLINKIPSGGGNAGSILMPAQPFN